MTLNDFKGLVFFVRENAQHNSQKRFVSPVLKTISESTHMQYFNSGKCIYLLID